MTTAVAPPAVHAATQYALDVQAGAVVAGPWVRLAAERHLRDLDRAGTDAFPYVFDEGRADKVIRFFRFVRFYEGPRAGEPFTLEPFQVFKTALIFGWVHRDTGVRRFLTAYIEEGKGNGKTPWAAVIALYMLVGDGEAGAQVYNAATKFDQAMLAFRAAHAFAEASPELAPRLTIDKTNIAHEKTTSFMRPIGSRVSGQSGPIPSCNIVDEIHEMKDPDVLNMLRRGTKSRRQPLTIEITNAGEGQEGIAWEHHQKSIKVLQGVIVDEQWFAYVCALDLDSHTSVYSGGQAIRRIITLCSCATPIATLIDKIRHADSAGLATSSGIGRLAPDPPIATRTNLHKPEDSAPRAIDGSYSKILSEGANHTKRPRGGPNEANGARSTNGNGSRPAPDIDRMPLAPNDYASLASMRSLLTASNLPDAESAALATACYASIMTMIQAERGDSSVPPATVHSAISGTLSRLYSAHSPTCKLRRSKLDGTQLIIAEEPDNFFADESCWIKANPGIDTILPRQYVRQQVKEGLEILSARNNVLRLNGCVWTATHTAWLDLDAFDRGRTDRADFGRLVADATRAYGGVDLSETIAMTAYVEGWRLPAVAATSIDEEEDTEAVRGLGRVAVRAHFFLPEDGILEREQRDGVPYFAWSQEGHITLTPGNVVDYEFIRKRLEDSANGGITQIGFDPWHARDLISRMEAGGSPVVEVAQSFTMLSDPCKQLERLIAAGWLLWEDNPVLRWHASNAVAKRDPNGNIKQDKSDPHAFIDGISALVTMLALMLRDPGDDAYSFDIEYLDL